MVLVKEAPRVGCSVDWTASRLALIVAAVTRPPPSRPVQIFYVPVPEEEILTAFLGLDTSSTPLAGDTSIRTVIGITVTQTGTLIFYDQWENDFDTEITDPDDLFQHRQSRWHPDLG